MYNNNKNNVFSYKPVTGKIELSLFPVIIFRLIKKISLSINFIMTLIIIFKPQGCISFKKGNTIIHLLFLNNFLSKIYISLW